VSHGEARGTPSTTVPRRIGRVETVTHFPGVGGNGFIVDYHYSMLYVSYTPSHQHHEHSIYLVLILVN